MAYVKPLAPKFPMGWPPCHAARSTVATNVGRMRSERETSVVR
jgi:hypothetical protein